MLRYVSSHLSEIPYSTKALIKADPPEGWCGYCYKLVAVYCIRGIHYRKKKRYHPYGYCNLGSAICLTCLREAAGYMHGKA